MQTHIRKGKVIREIAAPHEALSFDSINKAKAYSRTKIGLGKVRKS